MQYQGAYERKAQNDATHSSGLWTRQGTKLMLRRRLMIPPVAMALTLCLALTAVGFWVGRTIVQVMSDHLISEDEKVYVRADAAGLVLAGPEQVRTDWRLRSPGGP